MAMTHPRMGLLPGLVLVLALAVAGCGGGDKGEGVASLGGGTATSTTNAGASGGYDLRQALAFARCMRQHGVNLPDAQITAEGIDQPPAPGVHRDDPKQKAAEQACAQSLPPDKPGGGGK
jgi:hypothetical protein